jgi:ligand-binding SRPBCC domain-containing protein
VRLHEIRREQRLPQSPEAVFAFFADAKNLERITPRWLRFHLLIEESPEMGQGTLIRYRLRLHGVPLRWLARIEEWNPGRGFVDVQLRGPYRYWRHVHRFEPDEDSGGTVVTDAVRYAMRAGALGELVHRVFVRRDLRRIFDFRRDEVARISAGWGEGQTPAPD